MKRSWLLLGPFVVACGQDSEDRSGAPRPTPTDLAAPAQVSKPPAVVLPPADQAQLDRMILAGYTPHADHLHAPGVEQCPMAKGTEAVM
jgi:hypothetical protein